MTTCNSRSRGFYSRFHSTWAIIVVMHSAVAFGFVMCQKLVEEVGGVIALDSYNTTVIVYLSL